MPLFAVSPMVSPEALAARRERMTPASAGIDADPLQLLIAPPPLALKQQPTPTAAALPLWARPANATATKSHGGAAGDAAYPRPISTLEVIQSSELLREERRKQSIQALRLKAASAEEIGAVRAVAASDAAARRAAEAEAEARRAEINAVQHELTALRAELSALREQLAAETDARADSERERQVLAGRCVDLQRRADTADEARRVAEVMVSKVMQERELVERTLAEFAAFESSRPSQGRAHDAAGADADGGMDDDDDDDTDQGTQPSVARYDDEARVPGPSPARVQPGSDSDGSSGQSPDRHADADADAGARDGALQPSVAEPSPTHAAADIIRSTSEALRRSPKASLPSPAEPRSPSPASRRISPRARVDSAHAAGHADGAEPDRRSRGVRSRTASTIPSATPGRDDAGSPASKAVSRSSAKPTGRSGARATVKSSRKAASPSEPAAGAGNGRSSRDEPASPSSSLAASRTKRVRR